MLNRLSLWNAWGLPVLCWHSCASLSLSTSLLLGFHTRSDWCSSGNSCQMWILIRLNASGSGIYPHLRRCTFSSSISLFLLDHGLVQNVPNRWSSCLAKAYLLARKEVDNSLPCNCRSYRKEVNKVDNNASSSSFTITFSNCTWDYKTSTHGPTAQSPILLHIHVWYIRGMFT